MSSLGYSDSMASAPATRRRRAQIACRNCRKRKIRCVTNEEPPHNPCERCQRKGLQCEYVAVGEPSPPSTPINYAVPNPPQYNVPQNSYPNSPMNPENNDYYSSAQSGQSIYYQRYASPHFTPDSATHAQPSNMTWSHNSSAQTTNGPTSMLPGPPNSSSFGLASPHLMQPANSTWVIPTQNGPNSRPHSYSTFNASNPYYLAPGQGYSGTHPFDPNQQVFSCTTCRDSICTCGARQRRL